MQDVLKAREPSKPEELTGPFSEADKEHVLHELGHVLCSRYFYASHRSSRFLTFIVEEKLKGHVEGLRERSLGVALFGRDINYYTNADPVVRITAAEVRKRLSLHYQESGHESIRISLPAGTYIPKFEAAHRSAEQLRPDAFDSSSTAALTPERTGEKQREQHPEPIPVPSTSSSGPIWLAFLIIGIAAITAMFALASTFLATSLDQAKLSATDSSALSTFWKPFIESQSDVVLVFSEGGPRPGSAAFDSLAKLPNAPPALKVSSSLTGVGEVLGVHSLDEAFKTMHLRLRPKRPSLFTFDEADGQNLIFLGSPVTNPAMDDLQSTHDFVFRFVTAEPGRIALAILNNNPKPGEPAMFLSTTDTQQSGIDYAVIALMPETSTGRHTLLLGGINTYGTQAAADFVSDEDSLKTLLPQLQTVDGQIQPFEAVLRINVSDEVPLEKHLVAVHRITSASAASTGSGKPAH